MVRQWSGKESWGFGIRGCSSRSCEINSGSGEGGRNGTCGGEAEKDSRCGVDRNRTGEFEARGAQGRGAGSLVLRAEEDGVMGKRAIDFGVIALIITLTAGNEFIP
ncbi:hypothetical protein Pcinc_001586 [Petrolisthes cinctipes]|uniref:Uncharacterized protein n=1 Tax=Petrolisthes cinctipes TaxID=88211 RepID=A0AAE1L5W7_PETCI|nr:hypothetical protein Pcinc_001586 [Petrolisthes cinctipes]